MDKFTISLGDIPVEATDTDEELKARADQYLPKALKKIGEELGEKVWDAMKKGFSGGGMKFTASAAEKSKFIREHGEEYRRKASFADKRALKVSIFEQLRVARDKKAGI